MGLVFRWEFRVQHVSMKGHVFTTPLLYGVAWPPNEPNNAGSEPMPSHSMSSFGFRGQAVLQRRRCSMIFATVRPRGEMHIDPICFSWQGGALADFCLS